MRTGTPVPKLENEMKGRGAGEVITSKPSDEELAKYRSLPNPNQKQQSKKYDMNKKQYLKARASGKSRNDIALKYFGNNRAALKGFLITWGLLEPVAEKQELDKLRIEDQISNHKPDTKLKDQKKPKISKEFVKAEFALGKTAAQIEQEQDMSKNSLYYYLKKWGIRSPHGPGKKKVDKIDEQPQKDNTSVDTSQLAKQEEKDVTAHEGLKDNGKTHPPAEISSAQYITLRIPIIDAGWHPIEQRIKVYEELNEFSSEIESSNMNRERAAEELFDLIQAYAGLIRSDLADLLPGQDVTEQVQRFINYHNNRHTEKVRTYATERGWKVE